MTTPPIYHADLPELAKFAAQLRDQRAGYYGAEDARVARMGAVAGALAAIVAGTRYDDPVDWDAVRADLAATLAEAEKRAADSPGNTLARARADAVAALAWNFAPREPGALTPNRLFCHHVTLGIRARIAAEAAAPRHSEDAARPRREARAPATATDLFGQAA